MFLPPCSHPGSGPTLQTWGKAPPIQAPSFSTRTEISLKSTLLQVQEGGTPSVQAAAPPLWHSINWGSGSLPPRRTPPAAETLELVAGCPCSRLPGMPGQPSSWFRRPLSGSLNPQSCSGLHGSSAACKDEDKPLCLPRESLGAGSFVAILHLICMWFIKYKHA